jgi:hypothetical protein
LDASKAFLLGLPPYNTEREERKRAMAVAKDLAAICFLVPLDPAQA